MGFIVVAVMSVSMKTEIKIIHICIQISMQINKAAGIIIIAERRVVANVSWGIIINIMIIVCSASIIIMISIGDFAIIITHRKQTQLLS